MKYPIFIIFLILFTAHSAWSQSEERTRDVVQFSGMVLTNENGFMEPLPYANIYIKGTNRGTFSSTDGFFSLVGKKGEVVVFSSIGFEQVEFKIPESLSTDRYSIFQVLPRDTFMLPETVIYPWPSREHFKLEFLAMDSETELEARAGENLSDRAMAQLIAYLPADGDENVDFFLRQQAQAYYYEGQIRPMNVLNVFAWKQFIQALKRGDFKKKKKN